MLFHHRQKSELHRYGEMFKDPMDKIINFEYLMKFVKQALSYSDDKTDKLDTLNYIIDTVKIDLQTSLLANIFYDNGTPSDTTAPFPREYCDENGNVQRIFRTLQEDDEKIEVDLSKSCILTYPWDIEKFTHAISILKRNDFKYQKYNHSGQYYNYIDLCYTTCGFHSIATGVSYKKGVIMADVFHAERLFKHVYTDGAYWYNSHTKQAFKEVYDFRTAAIYEMCKIRLKLETE